MSTAVFEMSEKDLLEVTTRTKRLGNFDLVKRFEVDYASTAVSRWQSRVTGLSVVHLDYDGA
jgi:hypothetical protein